FAFSAATLLGFVVYSVLPAGMRDQWYPYVDSVMTTGLSLLFLLVPVKIIRSSFSELLHMTPDENNPRLGIETMLDDISLEFGIIRHYTHVVQAGRRNFVEINMLVDALSTLRDIGAQDRLREQIWKSLGSIPIENRLTIQITADPRWEDGREPD
ncbi:MAG: hypothetical protein V4793_11040, partial [Paraburkholderia tropica]